MVTSNRRDELPANHSSANTFSINMDRMQARRRSASLEILLDVLANWFCIPIEARRPRTQIELAKMLGIHIRTLVRLKQSPDLKRNITKNLRANNVCELPGMAENVVHRALKGDPRAIKIYFRLVGLM